MPDLVTGHRDFVLPCRYTLALPENFKSDREWPVVFALHGMGQHEDLMRRWLAPLLKHPWIFCFPRGPLPYEIRMPEKMRIGYAWYVFDGDQAALRASMALASTHLLNIQDAIRKAYPTGRSAIVGFSQGGYLAPVVATNEPQRFHAAASLCGRLKHEFMPEPGNTRLAQLSGGKDASITPELTAAGVAGARGRGYEVAEFTDPEAGHEVSPLMLEQLRAWLQEVLE